MSLFNRLRQDHNFLLGLDDYLLSLQALRQGFGLEDAAALEKLCVALWCKTKEDKRILSKHIRDLLLPYHQMSEHIEEDKKENILDGKTMSPPDDQKEKEFSPQPELSKFNDPPTPDTKHNYVSSITNDKKEYLPTIRDVSVTTNPMDLPRPRLSRLTEYYPVSTRQLKQTWRHLRRHVRRGVAEELDIDATIREIERKGILYHPVMLPRRYNLAQVCLLVDDGGSMTPFKALTNRLIETMQRGGRLSNVVVYYFHDVPEGYLYTDLAHTDGVSLEHVWATIGQSMPLLILSDAGSARNKMDKERVTITKNFISELRRGVRHFAWLNPVPRGRWKGTSAGSIASLVAMFEMSPREIYASVDTLRGRHIKTL